MSDEVSQLAIETFQSILRALTVPGAEPENTYRLLFSAHAEDLKTRRKEEVYIILEGSFWRWHCLGREFQRLNQLAKEAGLKLRKWEEHKLGNISCIKASLTLWDTEKEEAERVAAVVKINHVLKHLFEASKRYPPDGEVRQGLDRLLSQLAETMLGVEEMKTLGEDERWAVRWINEFAKLYQEQSVTQYSLWHEMNTIRGLLA